MDMFYGLEAARAKIVELEAHVTALSAEIRSLKESK